MLCLLRFANQTHVSRIESLRLVYYESSFRPFRRLTERLIYSARRASAGFTDTARCAGTKLAVTDANASKTITETRFIASQNFTPKSRLRISTDAPIEPATPTARP